MRLCLVPKLDIETGAKFSDFHNLLSLHVLWDGHFFEFADNGSSGCSLVVRVNLVKMGPF